MFSRRTKRVEGRFRPNLVTQLNEWGFELNRLPDANDHLFQLRRNRACPEQSFLQQLENPLP